MRTIECIITCISQPLIHWLTPRKGVHLFRYFLHSMRTPLWLFPPHVYMHFYCFVLYTLSAMALNAYTRDLWCTHWVSWHSMATPQNNRNAYMYEDETKWCTHWVQEIPKQVYAPSWCKPVDFLLLITVNGPQQISLFEAFIMRGVYDVKTLELIYNINKISFAPCGYEVYITFKKILVLNLITCNRDG